MRILHVAATDVRGGAAKSLHVLHSTLREAGHDSRLMLGRTTAIARPDVVTVPSMSWLSRLTYHGMNLMGLNYTGILGTRRLAEHVYFRQSDVVHYHNLHGGYFNYLALPYLTRLKPSVWTLRDMWALTGHCAHSFDCERWRSGCGRCPYPRTDPPIRRDATAWEWRLKQRVYERSRLTVICPSRWLAGLAEQSMLGVHPVHHIPNGVDTDVYRPADRPPLRAALNWPRERTVIMFAADSTANPFKDYALLLRALARIRAPLRDRLVLAVLGEYDTADDAGHGLPVIRLGYHDDDAQKARFYAAADIFVYPTRAEVQGRVLLEAMACGCPCVTVKVGGIPEFVRHGETGFLVDGGDAEGLVRGIETLIENPDMRAEMARQARRLMVAEYGRDDHCRRMLAVYAQAIQRHGS